MWHIPEVEQGLGDSEVYGVDRSHEDKVDEEQADGTSNEVVEGGEGEGRHWRVWLMVRSGSGGRNGSKVAVMNCVTSGFGVVNMAWKSVQLRWM